MNRRKLTAGLVTVWAVSFLLMQGVFGAEPATLQLDLHQNPRGDKEAKLTPNLEIRHPQLGLICDLQCYETGPFQQGEAIKKADGTVVFTYQSGEMT